MSYWKEFSGREIPVDGGPLSAKIVVDGNERGGFNLSAASYTIPVAAGASPAITKVRRPTRRQLPDPLPGDSVPGQAVVSVTKNDFYGPIVKNYVFNMVPDTTLGACGSTAGSWRRSSPAS